MAGTGEAFQSHLYGIERKGVTFRACLLCVFQSHLYGIERGGHQDGSHQGGQFQSHLYGIESTTMLCFKAFFTRFNRTFMELKVNRCVFSSAGSWVSIAPLWN